MCFRNTEVKPSGMPICVHIVLQEKVVSYNVHFLSHEKVPTLKSRLKYQRVIHLLFCMLQLIEWFQRFHNFLFPLPGFLIDFDNGGVFVVPVRMVKWNS